MFLIALKNIVIEVYKMMISTNHLKVSNGNDLMTEERVREIFMQEIEEVLRRNGIEIT